MTAFQDKRGPPAGVHEQQSFPVWLFFFRFRVLYNHPTPSLSRQVHGGFQPLLTGQWLGGGKAQGQPRDEGTETVSLGVTGCGRPGKAVNWQSGRFFWDCGDFCRLGLRQVFKTNRV